MKPLLLIGAGPMAAEYAKVLLAEKIPFAAVGRGEASAAAFREKTGVAALPGGLAAWTGAFPKRAIVAVGAEELAAVSRDALRRGARKLLVEKPAGLDVREIAATARAAAARRARVHVAFNRRFYASTRRAVQIVAEDGGVRSFQFEFTEWSHLVAKTPHPARIKKSWFFGNSSHVVDLAFFLGGTPKRFSAYVAGRLPWHPAGSSFAGAGITEKGALFSYKADWEAPGRWGVELMTRRRRLVLRPLEQLWVQKLGSLELKPEPLDDADDKRFKPGLRRQTLAFLTGKDREFLPTIGEHLEGARRILDRICPPSR